MDGYFINVDASSMMSKWLGEAEKNVSKLFRMARKYAEKEGKPVILFVDEVDSLLGSRNSEVGGEVRTKNQFLTEMDGVNEKGKDLMLYIIALPINPGVLIGLSLGDSKKESMYHFHLRKQEKVCSNSILLIFP